MECLSNQLKARLRCGLIARLVSAEFNLCYCAGKAESVK